MKTYTILICIIFCAFGSVFSQRTVTGTVTNDSGEPLPGVTIIAKGTDAATISDLSGAYSLVVPEGVKSLIFIYIGYENLELPVSDVVNAQLTSDTEIEEVVVTALGISRTVKALGYYSVSSRSAGRSRSDRKSGKKESSDSYSSTDGNVKSGLLTAGELNDYGKWELWEDISANELKSHKSIWHICPQQRYCVQVTNYSDNPVVNAAVTLKNKEGDVLWTALTDNTGKAELWLNMFKSTYSEKDLYAEVCKEGQTFKLSNIQKFSDGINFINIPVMCHIPDKADIAFVVDATGSMGDEILYLKAELEDVLNKIKIGHKNITVNTASVFYRDRSDAYLVQKSDFSDKTDITLDFIKKQNAGGGGDYPEAVDEGLNAAISELSWSQDALAKVIFLILDAPPHEDKLSVQKIQHLTEQAAKKGIRIVPITASGINKSTEYLMRSLALATNGTYVFLTDDSGIGGSHIKPTTDEYQVELLNDVFIRLINQYLTVPECGEEIVFDKEEIKDTSFIEEPPVLIDTSLVENNNTANIESEIIPGKVKYYPNPAGDILNIEIEGNLKEMFLADISGKILQRFEMKNEKTYRLSLANYPSGIYFIQYQNGECWKTGKVIHTCL